MNEYAHTWPLKRWLVVFLTIVFLGLVIDLRSEHVDVVQDTWEAWIPIVFSGIAFFVGLLTLIWWRRAMRGLFFFVSLCSVVVGGLGFWFHNGEHLTGNLTKIYQAWYMEVHHPDAPPYLAPLLFCLLGILGMVAAIGRSRSERF
ncbi:MAG: hypothetical protein JO308_17175 [Verrucomicrobia bacterium]|nr:hypothetical protein [Verrucomicrobiota bacterium]